MLIISSNSESTKNTNHILEIAVQAPGEFVIIVLKTLIISKITVASQFSYFVAHRVHCTVRTVQVLETK